MHLPNNVPPEHREVLESVHRAVGEDSRLVNRTAGVRVEYDASTRGLRLEGEVDALAHKRLLLRRARSVPAIAQVEDRVRVRPAQAMGDGEVRAHVVDALLQEPTLDRSTIRQWHKQRWETVRQPDQARAELSVRVDDGVVELSGAVPSLGHKRLAGVLAWWVPGTRDVRNALDVTPPERDHDGELRDAVSIAIDKDPLVDATGVQVDVQDGVVALQGLVGKRGERDLAERDAWYVEGVRDVRNELGTAKRDLSE